jgi:CRISPR-associated protein Cmr3
MSDTTVARFLVEPLEPITFGAPHSFAAGEAHRLRSEFPPSPRTFQGLVRSQLLRGANPPLDLDDWSGRAKDARAALVGGPDALPPGWQLQGPLPACIRLSADDETPPPVEPPVESWVEPWVPAPRFLLRQGQRAVRARPVESTHPSLSDLGPDRPLVGRPDLPDAAPLTGWLNPTGLEAALTGGNTLTLDRTTFGQLPPFVTSEYQPGLAIDRAARAAQGTARYGLLYFLQALRFRRDSGLLGGLRADLQSPLRRGALEDAGGTAGRKGRLVRFRAVERLDPTWERILAGAHLPEAVADGERFWLMTLTPVFLAHPDRPELRGAGSGSVEVRIVAALTGRPLTLGGFDMTRARPRPNRAYVPAGSAWLIELRGGTPQQRRERLLALHDAHPLGAREEAVFGFGHTLVGLGPQPMEDIL